MYSSFGALMDDAVAADAARMSGRAFADARGGGVARRVRTRRTVRAAGVGGASAVAVGAIAFGATHIPWGTLGAVPGAGETDCVTSSPSTGHLRYAVAPAEAEQTRSMESSDFQEAAGADVDEYWYQFNPSTGIPALEVSHMKDGRWFVTIGSGAAQQVEPDETGAVTIDVTVAGVTTSYRVVSTLGNIAVATTTTTVVEGSPPTGDCYAPSPTPTGAASLSPDVIATTDPSPAAKPDDITSPFQCGFVFPTESYGTDTQSIDGLEWVSPDEINAQIKAAHPGSGSDIYQAVGQGDVPVVTVNDAFGLSFGEWVSGGGDAIDPAQMLGERDPDARASGVKTAHGSSFVAVAGGVVVGTIVEPNAPNNAPPVYQRILGNDFDESLVLLNADNAFTACPVATLDGDWDLYAVAGDMARESDGRVHGPDYFWLKHATP